MSRADAVRAYRDSVYDAVEYEVEARYGQRSIPIVGGIIPGLQMLGNALWRPFKVTGAWIAGYGAGEREFPKMPPVPETFKGTTLEKSFDESWKLKEEATKARIEGIDNLLQFNISKWWQKNSVAQHVEARDRNVVFAEEGEARRNSGDGLSSGLAAGILASRSNSSGRSL